MTPAADGAAGRLAAFVNGAPEARVRRALTRCCGSARWVRAVLERRPYADDAAVEEAAEAAWWALERDDWLEAFAAHPRIGERGGGRWSAEEQAAAAGADAATRAALAEANAAYERRFGHGFLICATGRSAEAVLEALGERLGNEPAEELRVAAAEQLEITRRRLRKLATEIGDSRSAGVRRVGEGGDPGTRRSR